MKDKTYKNPPLNEMYIGVHFQAKPTISVLDFQQFALKMDGTDLKQHDYIFPIIERIANIDKIIAEPEKIWMQSEDSTRLLQFGRDRMIYNWRTRKQKTIYPKYESMSEEFFKYWKMLSQHITQYQERKLNITMCELYYSNILKIGEDHFLKSNKDLYKAINFISQYPKQYRNIAPQIYLKIPVEQGTLFLRVEEIKDDKNNKAFLLVFSMRSNRSNKKLEILEENWYDKANKNLRIFFEEMMTEEIKQTWKGGM